MFWNFVFGTMLVKLYWWNGFDGTVLVDGFGGRVLGHLFWWTLIGERYWWNGAGGTVLVERCCWNDVLEC